VFRETKGTVTQVEGYCAVEEIAQGRAACRPAELARQVVEGCRQQVPLRTTGRPRENTKGEGHMVGEIEHRVRALLGKKAMSQVTGAGDAICFGQAHQVTGKRFQWRRWRMEREDVEIVDRQGHTYTSVCLYCRDSR